MLINRKWHNSVIDGQSYNTYESMNSDHRPYSIKLRLSLRANKTYKSKNVNYNWALLMRDENVREAYTIEVKNRYQVLQNLNEEMSANMMYENIIQAHNESAKQHIPIRKRQIKGNAWETIEVCDKRRSLHEAYEVNRKNPNSTNRLRLENEKIELDDAYQSEQAKFVQEKVAVIEGTHTNNKARLAWNTVNEVSKKGQLRADSPEERVKLWKDHFEKLLGQSPVVNDQPVEKIFNPLPININDFTEEELMKANR